MRGSRLAYLEQFLNIGIRDFLFCKNIVDNSDSALIYSGLFDLGCRAVEDSSIFIVLFFFATAMNFKRKKKR